MALFGGGSVHRYQPNGAICERIELPVRLVSSCCFGRENLSDLYITTSRQGLAPGQEPESGSVFRASPGIKGLPTRTFTR